MTPGHEQESQRWLVTGQMDLEAAKVLRQAEHHALACFHCQQAAEKALKAVLYATGVKRIHGHAVQDLCQAVRRVAPEIDPLVVDAGTLDRYYIATRHPNGLPGGLPQKAFLAKDADDAIAIADRLIRFAETTIRRILGE